MKLVLTIYNIHIKEKILMFTIYNMHIKKKNTLEWRTIMQRIATFSDEYRAY